MASTTFSLEDVKEALLEKGFFAMEDSGVGARVFEMEEEDFPIVSERGLEFCKFNLLDDEVSKGTRCSIDYCLTVFSVFEP